jgi:GAF domain
MGRTAPQRISSITTIDTFVQVMDFAIVGLDTGGLARLYNERFPPDRHRPSEPLSRLLWGQPVFVPVVEESVLLEWTGDPDHVEMLRALGFRSCMMVPLVSCRVLIGALLCTNSASPLGLSDSGTELAGYYRVRPRRGGATETSPGRGRAPPSGVQQPVKKKTPQMPGLRVVA